MKHEKQEIDAAIAILNQTYTSYKLMISYIRIHYEYHYESMKLPESNEKFLQHYGAFYALDNITRTIGQPILPMIPEIQQRLNGLLACDKP